MKNYNFKELLSRSVENIDNVELFDVLEGLPSIGNGVWLAGGSIRRTLIEDLLSSDFDFFFQSKDKLESFKKGLESRGAKEVSSNEHQETFEITIDNNPRIIQLIKIDYYKNVEALLDSFDFTITQFAYDGTFLYCGDYSLWDLGRRKLALHKLTYGVATMRRLLKYTNQGFTACSGVMQSILESTVNNPSVINSDIQYID